MNDETTQLIRFLGLSVTLLVLVVVIGGGGCYGYPQYQVYYQRLSGEAKLREAESSRQIAVEEAKAKEQSAKLLADAEIIRAKGVAEANKIIGDSLANNPEYLTYLWIEKLDGSETIYVATEAGLPILEAGRLGSRRQKKDDAEKAEKAAKDAAVKQAKAGIAD